MSKSKIDSLTVHDIPIINHGNDPYLGQLIYVVKHTSLMFITLRTASIIKISTRSHIKT